MHRGLGFCIAAAALAIVAGASASARSGAGNGKIGYLRPLGGNEPPYGHLFAVNRDGSGPST